MDEDAERDTVDGDRNLLRRRFLKGVGGAVLGAAAGLSLMGCRSTNQSNNPNFPDFDKPENNPENPDGNPQDENPADNPGEPDDGGGDGGGDGGAP